MGSIVVYGAREIAYPIGGAVKEIDTEIWCQTPGVIGGAAAGSSAGALYLAKQLEELGSNVDLQPTYVQWTSTAGALLASQDDGWYLLRDLQVDYRLIGKGTVHFSCSFAAVNPGPPRRIGVYTAGGALSSNYAGAATNWLALPYASGTLGGPANRSSAEGAVSTFVSPGINPYPLTLSATIANWFKGGCHVFDVTAGIATNPVPTGGTFTHANWIDAKGLDHRFVGDVVVTNGLLLLVFSQGVAGPTVYLWNTALATPGWQSVGTIPYEDNGFNASTVQQISVTRVGLDEVALAVLSYTSVGGANCLQTYRLQRGSFAVRIDVKPFSAAQTSGAQITWNPPANLKASFSPAGIADNAVQTNVAVTADATYGYGAAFINNSTYPFIGGFLYQNQPFGQPYVTGGAGQLFLGDTSGPALNATRSYGFFAIPFGSVSGGTTVDKLQAEAEGGTLGTGWTSQANASASAGNEAKCASGTLTGNADTFGTAFVPPPQVYDVWFRVKVTSAAGAASEMKLGLYNSTDSVFVSSTTYKANQVTTGYLWYKVAAAVTPTATKNMRFRAETTATIGTDWFIDEAFLVPTSDGASSVRDLWQQFMYDRRAELVCA